MKKIKSFLAITLLSFVALSIFPPLVSAEEGGRFDEVLQKSTKGLEGNIIQGSGPGADANPDLLEYISWFLDLAVPIVISVGVLMVLFGCYKMMATDKEEAVKEGGRLVIYGVIGIIIMISAKFIGNTLVEGVISDSLDTTFGLRGVNVAESLYDKIMIPFLKVAAYLASGILFFIMAFRVFSFMVSQDEAVRKKATGLIIWSVIGIIVILAATQVVEAVFGKRDDVINQSASDIGEIGSGIYDVGTIPIIYSVINRIMGLTALAVLVLIIFQTFQLLTKPDSADNITKIKKTLMFVAIGVVIIGAGYVISNVLILN